MSLLTLRSSIAVGASGFTAEDGWSNPAGSFTSAGAFSIARDSADLGDGPTVVLFADFRGNAPGDAVSMTATIGSFAEMQESDGGSSDVPRYQTGPDGETWMNTFTPALSEIGHWTQGTVSTSNFDSWYISNRAYYDGSGALGTSNQKDVWVTRDGSTDSTHDQYAGALNGIFGNQGSAFYNDDSQADPPIVAPPNGGSFRRLTETFRSFGVRPHTTAAFEAPSDVFFQSCDETSGRYQSSSTNKETQFVNDDSPFAYNYIYIPGVFQDNAAGHVAGPPYATFYYWNDILIQTGPNAWKRFFITDASALEEATQIYDCVPASWSASEVTLRIPRGLSSYTGKYLWYGNGLSYTLVGTS